MNQGMLGLPGFSPDIAAGPWGNAAIPIRAVVHGNKLVISARSREGGVLGSGGPVQVMFPNADAAVADYRPKKIVQPVPPIVVASGSTMGFTNGSPGRLWVLLVDDIAGPCLAVINCLNSSCGIYSLGPSGRCSTSALGGGAGSAHTFYAARAITGRPYIVLGYFTWETALVTAGTWNAKPGVGRLFGPGVALPGTVVQDLLNLSGASSANSGAISFTDAAPGSENGMELFTQDITPMSAAHALEFEAMAQVADFSSTTNVILSLFRGAGTTAIRANSNYQADADSIVQVRLFHRMLAGSTSSTTYRLRYGSATSNTVRVNGRSNARIFGGVYGSLLCVKERVG